MIFVLTRTRRVYLKLVRSGYKVILSLVLACLYAIGGRWCVDCDGFIQERPSSLVDELPPRKRLLKMRVPVSVRGLSSRYGK